MRLALALCLLASSAAAQVINAGPPPASSAPPATAGLNGSAGTSTDYARADHTHASSVQKMIATTDANGNVTWTFGKPFANTSYAVNVLPGAAKTTCYSHDATPSSVVITCSQARLLPNTLLLLTDLVKFDVFANPAAGIPISAFAGAVTQ